jgi:2-haloacid dehalogenase
MMADRPSAVAFDVVETLMCLEPLAVRFEPIGLPTRMLREWFARLLLTEWDCRGWGLRAVR